MLKSDDRAIDVINEAFHDDYGGARDENARDEPVLAVIGDQLVLVRNGSRTEFSTASRLFDVIKSVAHVPIALYALFQRDESVERRQRVAAQRDKITAALVALTRSDEDHDVITNLRAILSSCLGLVNATLIEGYDGARLERFAFETGPRLLQCTHDATTLQLAALTKEVQIILGMLSDEETRTIHFVVAGDHQARERNLAMQFFQKLLADAPHAEVRLTYAESIKDVDAALALVGTQRLDRAIAKAFFGTPHRLQRDILGDAAKEQLAHASLPALVTTVA